MDELGEPAAHSTAAHDRNESDSITACCQCGSGRLESRSRNPAGLALAGHGRVGGTQPLRQRLQELPGDGAVALHQRAKLPEREPVADQVSCGGDRGRARAAVDQRDLSEDVAWNEGGEMDTFARDLGLSGLDEEERCASGPLVDDGLALREAALLEQAGDLL